MDAETLKSRLDAEGYIYDETLVTTLLVALKLGRPLLIEGAAGVGKTEIAKVMAKALDRELVRLQCYEGLDEAKALYEWNYRKQLLRIQAESDDTSWEDVQDDISGEQFLLQQAERPDFISRTIRDFPDIRCGIRRLTQVPDTQWESWQVRR